MRNQNGLDELGFTEWERKVRDLATDALVSFDALVVKDEMPFDREILASRHALSALIKAVDEAAQRMNKHR